MSSPPSECIAPSSEPDPTETLPGATIASRAEECRDAMFKSTDFLHKYEDGGTRSAKMRDLTGRFNIWASNMGVFAAFHASLDYRLRDLEEAKVLMLEHLDSMLKRTSRCSFSYQDENLSGRASPADEEIPDIEERNLANLTSQWELVRMRKFKLQNSNQLMPEEEQRRDKILAGFILRTESTTFQKGKEKTDTPHGEPFSGLSETPTRPLIENNVWMVPFDRNTSFTGRDLELKVVRTWLFTEDKPAKIAITGLGGIGKTHLVIELLYRLRDEDKNCSFLWISATSEESLSQAYSEAAKKLGISGYDDKTADVKKLMQDYLSSEGAGRWVMVFDNADDVSMWFNESAGESGRLIDYLPDSRYGSIIFTTRNKQAAVRLAGRSIVEVSTMDEADSEQVLRNCLLDSRDHLNNREDVVALLARLTYLPLAIVQAAAYINENKIGLGDYLLLLESQEEDVVDLLGEDFEDDVPACAVANTWLITFEQIRRHDPLAANYLSFMASTR
ncbi:hypothetical protein SBRCBS47491_010034 [Sporothrix bragantina]|uniref:NB-ARC domain-containing protein n=1 Tax=Sporothrix bragantina TaxID=671064 RepID=A0ABP0CZM4_9PEZI